MIEEEPVARIFGLPVYRSKWLPPNEVLVVSKFNRPYEDLTGAQLDDLLAKQLANPNMTYNDYARLMAAKERGSSVSDFYTHYYNTNSTVTTTTTPSNTAWWGPTNPPVLQKAVETTYEVGIDGNPVAVTKLAKPKTESDMAWLKRRVAEICWVPR